MVSAVGSLRREPWSVPGGRRRRAASGGRRPAPTLIGLRPHVPSADRADAEVVNSTGPWLGPAFAVSGSTLPPLLVGSSTVAGAQAAGDPAPGRGARAASGRRQQGPRTDRRR